MSEWLVRHSNRHLLGPVSTESLCHAIASGRVPFDAEASRVGSSEWLALGAYEEFKQALQFDDAVTRVTDSPWFGEESPPSADAPASKPEAPAAHAYAEDDDAETRIAPSERYADALRSAKIPTPPPTARSEGSVAERPAVAPPKVRSAPPPATKIGLGLPPPPTRTSSSRPPAAHGRTSSVPPPNLPPLGAPPATPHLPPLGPPPAMPHLPPLGAPPTTPHLPPLGAPPTTPHRPPRSAQASMPHIPPLAPPLTVSRMLEPTLAQPAVARRQPTIPPTGPHAIKTPGSGRLPAVPVVPSALGSGARPMPVASQPAPAASHYDDEDELTRVADHPGTAPQPAGGFNPRRAPTMPAISVERPAVVRAPAAFPPAPLATRPHDAKVVVRHDSVARALPAAVAAGTLGRPAGTPAASAARRDSAPAPGAAAYPFPYAIQPRPALDATSKALIALIIVLLAGLIVIVMLLIQRR